MGRPAPSAPSKRRRVAAVVAAALVLVAAAGAAWWWTTRSTPEDGPRAAVEQYLDGLVAGDCTMTHPVITDVMIGGDPEIDCRTLEAEAIRREVEVTTEVTEVTMMTGGTAAEVHATWSSVEASEELWFSVIEVDGRWLVDGRVFPVDE